MENFDLVEDLTDSTNSTQTFDTKLTLTKGVGLPSETYRIGFFAEIATSPGFIDYEVQLINTTTATVLAIEHKEQDEDDLRLTFTGFVYVDLSGVDQTFAIQWRRETGNPADIVIRNVRIEFWQATGLIGGAVSSVFGRTGAVVAATSDYDASQIDNDSGVAGATVKDALDALDLSTSLPAITAALQSIDASIQLLQSTTVSVDFQTLVDELASLITTTKRLVTTLEISIYGESLD